MFKRNDLNVALLKYQKAIECLYAIVCGVSEDFHMRDISMELKELAISLHLNVAVCAVKLNEFNIAIVSCSLVLEIDGRNVKAQGIYFSKIGKA